MAPASKSKFKLSFDSVKKDNKALAAEIEAFSRVDDEHEKGGTPKKLDAARQESLKELLRKLYTSICDLHAYRGSAATPDKNIIAAWQSFLEPITSLAAITPHGPLLAARMLLYLTRAFVRASQLPQSLPATDTSIKPIALRCNLLITLDNALLEHLKTLWTSSRGQETFAWVFSDYAVGKFHKCDNCCPDEFNWSQANRVSQEGDGGRSSSGMDWPAWSAARDAERLTASCLTAPEDLTPANGVHPVHTWRRPEGDATYHARDPLATSWMYNHSGSDPDTPRLLMFQTIGSEGPIREDYGYHIVDEDDGKSDWRSRPALRRSRQFILDTQKIRALRGRRRLASRALQERGLPAELVSEVWSYAEPVPEEPYLDKLDLVAVYQPFPDISATFGAGRAEAKCDECATRFSSSSMADKNAKGTCPLKAIVVWNLPLRTFHTLHKTTVSKRWRVCKHIPCRGHHDKPSAEEDWILAPRDLEAHLLQIIRAQAAHSMTLEGAGLGPYDPIMLPTEEEDNARKRRLWDSDHSDPKQRDAIDEAQWIGLDGLLAVMRRNKTLLGQHRSGCTMTDPSWIFGRTRQEEATARSVFRQMSFQ